MSVMYVIKRGDKYLKDGRYYHSDPVEVDKIEEARFFKSIQGARNSRYRIRKVSEEYERWSDNYRKTGIVTPPWERPKYYHPTDLLDGYSIVPVNINVKTTVCSLL